jgi:hypothetical protein
MAITAQTLRAQRALRALPEVKAFGWFGRVWVLVLVLTLLVASVVVLASLGLFDWRSGVLAPTPVPGPLRS